MDYLFAPERREGDGFVLRSYNVGDGALLADAVNESYEHLKPWMAWVQPDQSIEECERLVRQFRARYLLAEDFVFGIFTPDERRLLGGTGFHLREGPLSSACAEMGISIAPDRLRGSDAMSPGSRRLDASAVLQAALGVVRARSARARFHRALRSPSGVGLLGLTTTCPA